MKFNVVGVRRFEWVTAEYAGVDLVPHTIVRFFPLIATWRSTRSSDDEHTLVSMIIPHLLSATCLIKLTCMFLWFLGFTLQCTLWSSMTTYWLSLCLSMVKVRNCFKMTLSASSHRGISSFVDSSLISGSPYFVFCFQQEMQSSSSMHSSIFSCGWTLLYTFAVIHWFEIDAYWWM